MKKIYILACLIFLFVSSRAQSYEALTYNLNGTPVNGVNIKTQLPFTNGSQMISLKIEGYVYGTGEIIDLSVSWYIYNGIFRSPTISTAGSYTPEVFLTNNNGFVNVFINDKVYYQRFRITAFAKGMGEQSSWFQGWTTADEVMQGTQAVNLVYKNNFMGTVTNQGNLYSLGNVGIGTSDTKGYKLAVNGKIRAQEIKVEATNWPDYVFDDSYKIMPLAELKEYIGINKHLPDVPSAKEVELNGVNLGEMNKLLLKKVEELTLMLINQNDKIESQDQRINKLISEMTDKSPRKTKK
ncbi:hypothetical protein [Pedobacter sp. B4-66]|uniref:hypothetical protein n=1 Tax=Pedobacter sp. B4-66 TaxID=2817280 RepID=UPI001BDA5504|nr:hypothetical protein [Pedobacter sp. B4-66]